MLHFVVQSNTFKYGGPPLNIATSDRGTGASY